MFDTLMEFLGLGPSGNFAQLRENGAIILDVRTPSEYAGGHVKGSVNISLDVLPKNLQRLPDKNRAIIAVCASGVRSGAARSILLSHGYAHVYNGGGWISLEQKLIR